MSARTQKSDGTWKLIVMAAVIGLVGMLSLLTVQQRVAYKATADSTISAPLPATASVPASK